MHDRISIFCSFDIFRDSLQCFVDIIHSCLPHSILAWYVSGKYLDYYTIDGKKYNCYLYARYFHGNRGHLGPVETFTCWIASIWKKAFHQQKKHNWKRKIARKDMTQNNGIRFSLGDIDAGEFD